MSCCTPTNPSGASGLSGRVARLRADYLASKPNISASRALAFTETYKRYPGMPPIKLRALAFKRACETAPLAIFPEELIVSHPPPPGWGSLAGHRVALGAGRTGHAVHAGAGSV